MNVELKVGTKELKLRLGAQQIVAVERKLGTSILTVLVEAGNGQTMMQLEKLLIILHGALQKYEHGYTMESVYDLYDEFVEEGGSFMDLVEKLADLLTVSGFFNKAQVEEMNKAKNSQSKK